MKLLIVSNQISLDKSIGGAVVPCWAFKSWCDLKNVNCQLISEVEFLNSEIYNVSGIFFTKVPNSIDTIIKAKKLNCKILLMMHAEFDIDMYINARKAIEICDSIVGIGFDNYWGEKHKFDWHPCTLPYYLIKGDEIWDQEKIGTIYRARLSSWKNALMLSALSKYGEFQKNYGPIHVYGQYNKLEYRKYVESLNPNWHQYCDIYDIRNIDTTKLICQNKKFIWDVSGNNEYEIKIKRLNLAAFEAMKFGCIPIVNQKSIPSECFKFCQDISFDSKNHSNILDIMRDCIPYSRFGYYGVEKQIESILNFFGD